MDTPLLYGQHICAERFYYPLLQRVLSAFAHSSLTLAFDPSALWNQYCLVEVSLIWGDCSLTVAQTVLEHPSASVAFKGYQAVLERTYEQIPPGCSVTLLADRGFDHKHLLQWLQAHQWEWVIRLKGDVSVRLASGRLCQVDDLWPPQDEIEPHFKDYKSAGFDLAQSRLRDAQRLTSLVMLLDMAHLIAVVVGMLLVQAGCRTQLDWSGERGLSFLQLGASRDCLAVLCDCACPPSPHCPSEVPRKTMPGSTTSSPATLGLSSQRW